MLDFGSKHDKKKILTECNENRTESQNAIGNNKDKKKNIW